MSAYLQDLSRKNVTRVWSRTTLLGPASPNTLVLLATVTEYTDTVIAGVTANAMQGGVFTSGLIVAEQAFYKKDGFAKQKALDWCYATEPLTSPLVSAAAMNLRAERVK